MRLRDDDAEKIAAAARDPQPVREGDSLGRAGRVGPNGGRVETARARPMTAEDERRVRINDRAMPGEVEITDSLIVYQPPAEPADTRDEHRALLHLDGTGEPRPPKQWEEMEARRRAEIGARERETAERARRREREDAPLDQLVALMLQELLKIPSPRAKQTRETDARSAIDGDRSPQGEGHGAVAFVQEAEVDGRLAQIRAHALAVWDAIDAHHGRSHKSLVMMSSEEKDALLTGRTLRGLSPEQINALHPELGSAKTIRHVRSCAGQNGRGEPKREAA